MSVARTLVRALAGSSSNVEPLFTRGLPTRSATNVRPTAAADHVLNRLYIAYAGLMFYIFWTNRRELYEGPVVHGIEYGRRAYLRYRKRRPGGPPGPLSMLTPLLYSEKCSDENDNGDIKKPGGDGRDNGGGGKTPA